MSESRGITGNTGLAGLAAELRAGRSARELVELSLSRIAEHSQLGAVVAVRAEEARAEADDVDTRRQRGEALPALAGMPMLVKDNQHVTGMRTTNGSLAYADAAPEPRDSVTVERLRAAGALVVGKTNVPEFCVEGFTDNALFGPTRNPWNTELSPGGSSGGSAAALAAGIVPLATGTDGAGSVRIPAAFCGLIGFKPSNGAIGRSSAPDWIDFSTPGFMTPHATDLPLLFDRVAGSVPGDPTALPVTLPSAAAPRRAIAATRTEGDPHIDPDVAEAFERALAMFAEAFGIEPELRTPRDFFPDSSPDSDWYVLAAAEHATSLDPATLEGRLLPGTRAFIDYGLGVSTAEYIAARRRRFDHSRVIDEALSHGTVLLTPTVPMPGWAPDGGAAAFPDNLMPAEYYGSSIQNLTGVPALSLPAGTLPNGLPFGLQVTGARWSDRALMTLAQRWQAHWPFPANAPGYSPFN